MQGLHGAFWRLALRVRLYSTMARLPLLLLPPAILYAQLLQRAMDGPEKGGRRRPAWRQWSWRSCIFSYDLTGRA
jgi:hypothetical protein